jgi:hypothetical protein
MNTKDTPFDLEFAGVDEVESRIKPLKSRSLYKTTPIAVPKTTERNVKRGSSSSLTSTRYLEASPPVIIPHLRRAACRLYRHRRKTICQNQEWVPSYRSTHRHILLFFTSNAGSSDGCDRGRGSYAPWSPAIDNETSHGATTGRWFRHRALGCFRVESCLYQPDSYFFFLSLLRSRWMAVWTVHS